MSCHISGQSLRLFFCRPRWLLVPFLLLIFFVALPEGSISVIVFGDCVKGLNMNTLMSKYPQFRSLPQLVITFCVRKHAGHDITAGLNHYLSF